MPKQITGDEPANILTIRQDFAARAMKAIVNAFYCSDFAHRNNQAKVWIEEYRHDESANSVYDFIIKDAAKISDALIAELNKEI